MSFSSDHNEKNVPARVGGDRARKGPRVERRLTLGLVRASQLAAMVARSRAAAQVEIADLLAGMYIYEWDRLSVFWTDGEAVEDLLRKICGISTQRWNHWLELYDRKRRQEQIEASSPWRRLMQRARSGANESEGDGENLPRSLELEHVLRCAGEISPFRDDAGAQPIPVLTAECVLLCIVRNEESDLGRSLRETGLDIAGLERAARDPRRVPYR